MKNEKQINDKLTRLCRDKYYNKERIEMLEWVLENKTKI